MFKRLHEMLSSLLATNPKRLAEAATSESPSPPSPHSGDAEPKSAEDVPLAAPFDVVRVAGAEAPGRWDALRKRSGIVPVLLGNRDSAKRVLEAMQLEDESFESIRDAGLRLDVDEWIAERLRGDPEHYVVNETHTGPADRIAAFSPAYDILTRKPYPEVYFGLIPVDAPWLVPAYLKFGGWNDCPDAVVQLAFFRRWFERYGAVVTTVAGDVIEFNVARPPTSPEASRELALEQYVYCTDIVDQGVQTLGNLTAALQGSSNWYFWWD
jgi:hypothetical protein